MKKIISTLLAVSISMMLFSNTAFCEEEAIPFSKDEIQILSQSEDRQVDEIAARGNKTVEWVVVLLAAGALVYLVAQTHGDDEKRKEFVDDFNDLGL